MKVIGFEELKLRKLETESLLDNGWRKVKSSRGKKFIWNHVLLNPLRIFSRQQALCIQRQRERFLNSRGWRKITSVLPKSKKVEIRWENDKIFPGKSFSLFSAFKAERKKHHLLIVKK